MALDDVVKTTITGPRIEEAMYRTLRWIDRCIAGNVYSCISMSCKRTFQVLLHQFFILTVWLGEARFSSTLTSLNWCAAHKRPHEQNLFGIVQGGLDPVLR